MTNTTTPNVFYPVANATASSNPFVWQFEPRNPTTSDVNYPIQKVWLNTATNILWFLRNFTTSNGIISANWIQIGSASATPEQFLMQSGTSPVVPNGSNQITFNGVLAAAGTTPVQTVGTAATTMALEVQTAQAIASTNASNIGLAAFNSSQFSVDANGFVSLTGSGSSILQVTVDAHTAPGTEPVVPNGSGNITVTGGQIAAGTTTNVIRTDSLAANTYTIEVQRSQAVASSTIGDNGVCHFNSGQFTVDANGFVSATGTVPIQFTGNTGTATPSGGNINLFGASTPAGTTPVSTVASGSTVTVDVQKTQAVASSVATTVGLASFNSTYFTVDANGFVSPNGSGLGETITGNSGGALSPTAGNWNILGGTGITTSGSGSTLTINATGVDFVPNYTNVNHAVSPYTVLTTDYYISVDTSGGTVTLNFPNAPAFKQIWIVKDRTGTSATNNISITTPGGTVTFDGQTTYTINTNYESIELLANATPTYEVF